MPALVWATTRVALMNFKDQLPGTSKKENKIMLRDMKEMQGYTIQATDGEIGKVQTFYFDDRSGTVRYLVADTGGWLSEQLVLIAPAALGQPNWSQKKFPVNLTKVQIENSPPVGTDQPISRQMETHLRDYYGWDPYWQMTLANNPWQSMGAPVPSREAQLGQQARRQEGAGAPTQTLEGQDAHLRSSEEVIGYHIQAQDGEIGHVETFLVDDATWRIRYLVVDTHNWLPGKKVLVAPEWIEDIDWAERKVFVDLTRQQIKSGPTYEETEPVSREFEKEIYEHYGYQGYWML